jgi:hypothetical protein
LRRSSSPPPTCSEMPRNAADFRKSREIRGIDLGPRSR